MRGPALTPPWRRARRVAQRHAAVRTGVLPRLTTPTRPHPVAETQNPSGLVAEPLPRASHLPTCSWRMSRQQASHTPSGASGRSGSPEVPTLPAPGAFACRTLSALLSASPASLHARDTEAPCGRLQEAARVGASLRPKLTAEGFHCASQTLHSSPVPRSDPPAQTCRLPGLGAWPPRNWPGPWPTLHPRQPSGPCGLPGLCGSCRSRGGAGLSL